MLLIIYIYHWRETFIKYITTRWTSLHDRNIFILKNRG